MRLTTALGPQDPGSSRSRMRCGGPRRRRPLLGPEPLEHRALPANTFLVTGLGDTGAASGPLAGDLRYCITHAQDGDTVTFDQSLSGPTATAIDLTTVGDTTFGPSAFLISKAITIDGSGVTNLVIERSAAAGTPNFRIFDVAATGSLTLEHLTISNGVARDDGQAGVTPGSSDAQGGGILDDGGAVTLVDATVANNQAQAGDGRDAQGGGIYAAGGTVQLTGATLSGNTARGGSGIDSTADKTDGGSGGRGEGGGLYAVGGTLVADGATIAGNTAAGGVGGKGFWVWYAGNVTASGPGGSAQGGGIDTSGVSATLGGVVVTGNTARGGTGGDSGFPNPMPGAGADAQGGGILAEGGSVRLIGATLSGNTAAGGAPGSSFKFGGGRGRGGALDATGVVLVLDNVTVSGNTVTGPGGTSQGAGIFAGGGSAAVTNVTLTDNTARGDSVQGGALYLDATTVMLDHDTITGNRALANDGNGGPASGGGLYLSVGAGSAMLTATAITNNNVTSGSWFNGKGVSYGITQGGGLFASVGNGGGITLDNDTISGNTALNQPRGGGVFINAGGGAQVVLRHDTIANNLADAGQRLIYGGAGGDAQGGGVFVTGGMATLEDDVITGNSARAGDGSGWFEAGNGQGGGIYAGGVTMSLIGDTIAGNTVLGGVYGTGTFLPQGISQGGGVFATGGQVTLTNDTIRDNTALGGSLSIQGTNLSAPAQGGGLFASGASLMLTSVTVAGNSARGGNADKTSGGAAHGGGLYIAAKGGANATLMNVTVANNSAVGGDNSGAGLTIGATDGGSATLVNVTIARNTSRTGNGPAVASSVQAGGLDATGGPVLLDNTLVALNTQAVNAGPTSPSDIGGTVDPASASNLIGSGGAGGLVGGMNHNRVGVADPLLGPLADNGGATMTLALLYGSPAFNAGDNAVVSSAGLANDQRGLPRVVAGRVDVGAFESQVTLAGPSVTGVQRFGYHARPTTLVLSFDQPLDSTSATKPSEYRLTLRGRKRPIPIVSVAYDPTAMTVTLGPAVRLPLRNTYVLTVTGTPPGGVQNPQGQFLEGAGPGQSGTDYTTTVTRKDLVMDAVHRVRSHGLPAPVASARHILRGPTGAFRRGRATQ